MKTTNIEIHNCGECEYRDGCKTCEVLKKFREFDEEVEAGRLKYVKRLKIVIITETIMFIGWAILLLTSNLNIYIFVALFVTFGALSIHLELMKRKFTKLLLEKSKQMALALGVPPEKLVEIERMIKEGEPPSIAEKMRRCKLRKKHGANYCIECKDSYDCARTV
jgi:hypothetical protein